MSHAPRLLAAVLLLAVLALAGGAAADGGTVVAIYPDPIADGDAGEFVVLDLPAGGNVTVSDGEQTVRVPANATGRVAITDRPDRVESLTDARVVGVETFLALANDGDEVIVRQDGRVLDRVAYDDPEEGAIGWIEEGITWRHVDATDFEPVEASGGRAEAFLLPDADDRVCRFLGEADRRIDLAGYTLTSRCVTDRLIDAAERGVEVRVLVDGRPAGGVPPAMAHRLDRLAASPATVRVVAGEAAPVRFHHAKYAVVDDRALVTTENFKPAGTGGAGSRGWGTIVTNDRVVERLSATLTADAAARGVDNYSDARDRISVADENSSADGAYPARIEPQSVALERTTLLLAPDNAGTALAEEIRRADRRVLIEQAGIGGLDVPLVRASIDAAENGTRVRMLLSSAWYAREDNREVVESIRALADRRDLPIEARLAAPNGRFEKVHAKGVVVDDRAYVGSLNWNNHSITQNREVVVGLVGDGAADYFAAAFRADWLGGIWRLPIGLVAIAALGWIVLGWLGRKVRFEDRNRR